jgi:virginiamycin B lyase
MTSAFHSAPVGKRKLTSRGIIAGIVRHMRPTRDGNFLIHQSSTNRILLVTTNSVANTQ